MSKVYNLAGNTYGKLIVIKEDGRNKWKEKLWLCKCNCGKYKCKHYIHVTSRNLGEGRVQSSGVPDVVENGSVFKELTVVKIDHIDNRGRYYYLCNCSCGKTTVVAGSSLRSGSTISCGHVWYNKIKQPKSHGLSHDPAYNCWCDMVHRVTHKCDRNYERYTHTIEGALIEEEWINDPQKFLDYIGKRPSKEYSIDRINPTKGYVKGNVRWADRTTQAINKIAKNNKIIGVNKNGNSWSAMIQYRKKSYYLGTYKNKIDAMKARYEAEEKFGFPHSFSINN